MSENVNFRLFFRGLPSLKKMKIPLVMDREAALMKAVQSELPIIALYFAGILFLGIYANGCTNTELHLQITQFT